MGRSSSTSALTQGAILTAIYLILLLIVTYIPLLNLVMLFFLPVPFMLHVYKHGLKAAALVALAALFLTPLMTPLPTIVITFFSASVGMVMGYSYVCKKGPFVPMLAGIITYIFNYLLAFVLAYLVFGVNVIDVMKQLMEETFSITEGTADFLKLPLDEEQLSQYKQTIQMIEVIFPALMIMSSIVMGLIHHVLSRPILTRLGCEIEKLPPFREWNLPKSILFYYLISLILLLIGMPEGSTFFIITVNLHPILEFLLLIQGISVIAYFAHWRNIGKVLPIMAVIMIFLFPPSQFILRLLGIFELGFGLKQRMK